MSTDLLLEILRTKNKVGVKVAWNAAPKAIMANADWFFPYLERFAWGITSQTESYLIEGVDFLPCHVKRLSDLTAIRSVFLGCFEMSLERFDKYPGHSPGYGKLPKGIKQQIVRDIPLWSRYIQQETKKYGCPFVDMSDNFHSKLKEAEKLLTGSFGSSAF